MVRKIFFAFLGIQLTLISTWGQTPTQLSLSKAIELANDSSLAAFQAQNLFLAASWNYRNYIAGKKPGVNLSTNPLTYNRLISKQFNPADTTFNFYQQQNLSSTASLGISQNITPTGGKLYVNSDLGRLQNFGSQALTQFSVTPVRVGIYQPIFGFNTFKWDKKIEPLKFEKAKKDFIASYEKNAVKTVDYYFNLATAQQNFQIARTNNANADTLFNIGQKRFEISTITKADLLNLKLELLNSKDQLSIAKNNLDRAKAILVSFLVLGKGNDVELILPEEIPVLSIEVAKALEQAQKNSPDILNLQQQALEANKNVERAKKESQLNSSLDVSYGLNQTASRLQDAYKRPLEQDAVNISINIPIVDWGLRKGQYNLARRQRDAQMASIKQSKIDFEQDVIMTISEFNIQKDLVNSAREASKVANEAFGIYKLKFINGQTNINELIIQLNRKDAALRNYIATLQSYWKYYYSVRNITQYDFEKDQPLTIDFEKMSAL